MSAKTAGSDEEEQHVGDEPAGHEGRREDADVLHDADVRGDTPALLRRDLVGDGREQRAEDGVAGQLREAPPGDEDRDVRSKGDDGERGDEADGAEEHPWAAATEARERDVGQAADHRVRDEGEQGGDGEDVAVDDRRLVTGDELLRLEGQAHGDGGEQGHEQTELGERHGGDDPFRRPFRRSRRAGDEADVGAARGTLAGGFGAAGWVGHPGSSQR